MKVWRTTYKEFNDKFSGGFNRLRFNRREGNIEYGGFIKNVYRTIFVYNAKKDCTYVGWIALGYIDLFGPSQDDFCLAVKYDGKVNMDDFIVTHKDDAIALCEETQKEYDKKMEAYRSSKEED